ERARERVFCHQAPFCKLTNSIHSTTCCHQPYSIQHCFQLQHHLMIPKAQDFVALCRQPLIRLFICFDLFCVLSSIEFNNQAAFMAEKIYNITPHWNLSSELEAHEAAGTQVIPKTKLGIGLPT